MVLSSELDVSSLHMCHQVEGSTVYCYGDVRRCWTRSKLIRVLVKCLPLELPFICRWCLALVASYRIPTSRGVLGILLPHWLRDGAAIHVPSHAHFLHVLTSFIFPCALRSVPSVCSPPQTRMGIVSVW